MCSEGNALKRSWYKNKKKNFLVNQHALPLKKKKKKNSKGKKWFARNAPTTCSPFERKKEKKKTQKGRNDLQEM